MRTVWVVWWCVLMHWSLANIIGRVASIRHVISTSVLLVLVLHKFNHLLGDGNLFALWTQLNDILIIVTIAYSALISLPLAWSDNHVFSNLWVFHWSVCTSNSFRLILLLFHMLISQNQDIGRLFDKESIRLIELPVPKEKNVPVYVTNDPLHAFTRTINDLDHVVNVQSVPVWINCVCSSVNFKLLVDVDDFDVSDLAIVIDDFEIVVLDLEDDTHIFVIVIANHVISFVLVQFEFIEEACNCALINFWLEFEMISQDLDFSSVLKECNVHNVSFWIYHYSWLTLVLAINDSYLIARLKVLHNVSAIDLENVIKALIIWLEMNIAVLYGNYCSIEIL